MIFKVLEVKLKTERHGCRYRICPIGIFRISAGEATALYRDKVLSRHIYTGPTHAQMGKDAGRKAIADLQGTEFGVGSVFNEV